MSFQGDVGGIGLAELLQSLSRGRREGVLRLHTKGGLHAVLVLNDGVISFLPGEQEDSNKWKEHARQAWIHDQDFRIDAMRMSDIAKAHRVENMYNILDSEEVHFRFNPGESIRRPTGPVEEGNNEGGVNAARSPEVYCDGMAVEMFLLEFARLSDETEGVKDKLTFNHYIVPRVLDAGETTMNPDRFLSECDGTSTLAEISNRLGMPLRQTRLLCLAHIVNSRVRIAGHRELLVLAQKELAQGHVRRAAARLVGWIQASPPGALDEGDAGLLANEFKADRMGPLLNLMPEKVTRQLLRRLDHALLDPEASVRHWRELHRLKRNARIIEVHCLAVEFNWEEDPESPSLRELLDGARQFREEACPWRAQAFLRMAASREPTNANARLDIGLGMLAAGMIEEAAAWILDASQTLVAAGHPNKAIPALRTLLETDGSIREARRMLGRLKHLTVRRQLIRKNSLVGVAIVAVLAAAAWVRISSEEERELKMAEIADLIETPVEASALLDAYFPVDDSERVSNLREMILDRRKYQESEWRNDWHERYREAQLACRIDDPLVGLKRAYNMPEPPHLITVTEPWPLISDLFNGLAVRLEVLHAELGELSLEGLDQGNREKELKLTLDEVLEHVSKEGDNKNVGDLPSRLESLSKDLIFRIKERSRLLDERAHKDLRFKQDLMLAGARADSRAGHLERSLETYERLLLTDDSGRLTEILEEEMTDLRKRLSAIAKARSLASAGKHQQGIDVLIEAFGKKNPHTLPWTFDAFPAGALVHMADGSKRPAPFIYESRPGERVEFFVEFEGHQSQTIVLEDPSNTKIWLSKLPERSWRGSGRIDALPVQLDGDQIVCDRTGLIARLSAGGEEIWKLELLSLGGIGRAPVPLPNNPERLLLLTEDGESWLIDGTKGKREGPWALKSGPLEGPAPSADGVLARLKNGKLMKWTNRLRPETVSEGTIPEADARGTLGGMAVLHRGEGGKNRLDCPWTKWTVELKHEIYRIYPVDTPEAGFAVRRDGDWSYLAWEAPTPALPQGRLWISDAAGLAAYLP